MSITGPWPAVAVLALLALLPVGHAGAIQSELWIDDAYMAWLYGDYALGAAALALWGPRATARWGARRVRLIAMAALIGAAVLAATADAQQTLFAARWLQGAGAMLLLHTTHRARPCEERLRQAAATAAALVGGMTAGLLGGMITSPHLTWRWMFVATLGLVPATTALLTRPTGKRLAARPRGKGLPALLLATGSLQCLVYGATATAARGGAEGAGLPLLICATLLGAAARATGRTIG